MKMRYRKPSVKTVLGVTKLKKRVKKSLGLNKLLWPFRAVNNYQRRILRRAGYYSPELKALRAAKQGKVAGPIGALHLGEGEHESGGKGLDASALLLASALGADHDKKGEGATPLLLSALLAGEALEGEGKGHKKGGDAPNLGEALLLSTALKGSEGEHASKAKSAAHTPQAKQAAAPKASAASRRAPRAKSAKAKKAEDKPAPKRHRGFRLFGLLLVAVLVASAIFAVWYYWVI